VEGDTQWLKPRVPASNGTAQCLWAVPLGLWNKRREADRILYKYIEKDINEKKVQRRNA